MPPDSEIPSASPPTPLQHLESGGEEAAEPRSVAPEILAAALLSSLLFWGLRFFPILGLILFIPAAAVPLVRLGVRRGVGAALAASGGAAIVSGAFALALHQGALGEGLTLLATAGACGVAGGISRSRPPSAAFLGLCLYGALAAGASAVSAPPQRAEIDQQFNATSRIWMETSRRKGTDPETLKSMQGALDSARRISIEYAPGLLAVVWIFFASIAFFLGRWLGRTGEGGEDFSAFRLPSLLAALFVISGAIAALQGGDIRRGALDVLGPLLALYFLAGLSIIAFFARRWLRTRFFRAALYVSAFCFPVSLGTAGLGLFDWYFDFRKRAGQAGQSESKRK